MAQQFVEPLQPELAGQQNTGQQNTGVLNDLSSFFGDPNTIRALSTAGRGFSQGREVGDVLGETASELNTNVQLQKANAEQSRQKANIMRETLKALAAGNLVGDPNDNSTFDKAVIDGAGKFTLSGSNAVNPLTDLQDVPIESQTRTTPQLASNAIPQVSPTNQTNNQFDFLGDNPIVPRQDLPDFG